MFVMRSFLYSLLFFTILISLLVSSCSSYFYAAVTSRGSAPEEASYYITHNMGDKIDYLEFKEFSSLLRNNLNELGYVSRNEDIAYLSIHLNYYIGNKETLSTTSKNNDYIVNTSTFNTKTDKKTTSESNTKQRLVDIKSRIQPVWEPPLQR